MIHFELPLNRLHLRKRKETNQNRTQNSEEVLTVLIFITSTVHNHLVILKGEVIFLKNPKLGSRVMTRVVYGPNFRLTSLNERIRFSHLLAGFEKKLGNFTIFIEF